MLTRRPASISCIIQYSARSLYSHATNGEINAFKCVRTRGGETHLKQARRNKMQMQSIGFHVVLRKRNNRRNRTEHKWRKAPFPSPTPSHDPGRPTLNTKQASSNITASKKKKNEKKEENNNKLAPHPSIRKIVYSRGKKVSSNSSPCHDCNKKIWALLGQFPLVSQSVGAYSTEFPTRHSAISMYAKREKKKKEKRG